MESPTIEINQNEKIFKIKHKDLNYNLSISSDSEKIKLLLKSESPNNFFFFEEIYTLKKLSKINNIFLAFDSIKMIRNSIEDTISNNKFSIKDNYGYIGIILKVPLFQKLVDINLVLNKKI